MLFSFQGLDNSTELLNYKTGVKMGCWGLTIYSVAMVFFSGMSQELYSIPYNNSDFSLLMSNLVMPRK